MYSIKKLSKLILAAALVFELVSLIGCRGYTSSEPPIHVNPNMDLQDKGKAYRASNFFEDGVYMRSQIGGTIARGQLKADEHFYYGLVNGQPARSFPSNLIIDEAFMARGQQMFNRTCAACHSQIGDGQGLVGKRLLVTPTSFHSEYMYNQPPGHFLEVINKGIRTMPPYEKMLKPYDRWAVVAYIRSLQMSQDMDGEWIKRSASWWKQP